MLVSDSVSLTLFELGLSSSLSSTWDVPTETPVSNLESPASILLLSSAIWSLTTLSLLIFPLSGDIGKPLLTGSDVLSLLVPSIDALSLSLVPSIGVMLVCDSVSLTLLFELGLCSSLSSTWEVPTETQVSILASPASVLLLSSAIWSLTTLSWSSIGILSWIADVSSWEHCFSGSLCGSAVFSSVTWDWLSFATSDASSVAAASSFVVESSQLILIFVTRGLVASISLCNLSKSGFSGGFSVSSGSTYSLLTKYP